MRVVRRLLAAVAVAFVGAVPAAADTPKTPAIFWLMDEPVTLFDLGLFRLRRDMEAVSRWLSEQGYASETPLNGAYYEWRERKIIAYVSIRDSTSDPGERQCREVFGRAVRWLIGGAPQGPRQAMFYLENLFLHQGPGNVGRPQNLGQELVEAVRMEVTLLAPGPVSLGGTSVRCSGQLDTDMSELTLSVTE